jgi:hypothetical protein
MDKLCVSPANLCKWAVQKINEIDPLDVLFTKKKKAVHPSPLGQLMGIKEPLLRYIFELREQGLTVNTFVIALSASYISTKFCKKSFTVQCSAVKPFCYAHSMTYQMDTHMLQHLLAQVESKALNYMRFMHQIVLSNNCDLHYVLNMDQTTVYFSMNAKHTPDLIRGKTVPIHTSSDDTKRVTVVVTIGVDGTVLPLMLIFKSQPNERIARTKFATYLATHPYRCQANAWMGEVCMIAWVDEVLVPYVATATYEIVPLLALDSYQCHMMASVVQMIQELGVEVKHITGVCTPLCQPVNIAFNKPFKDCMRRQWM